MMLTIPFASKATPAAAAAPNALAAVVDARRADLRSAGQATVHAFANALSSLAMSGASSEIKTKAMVAIKQVLNWFCSFFLVCLSCTYAITSRATAFSETKFCSFSSPFFSLFSSQQGAKFFFGAVAQHYKEFLPPLVHSLKEIDLRVRIPVFFQC